MNNILEGSSSSSLDGKAKHERLCSSLLRQLMRQAVQLQKPGVTEEAHTLLLQYALVLRQAQVPLPQARLLTTLVKLATGIARICHRQQVLQQPDAVIAIALMECSLSNQVGGSTPWGSHDMPRCGMCAYQLTV
jgi:DNA replicative helicase MCM subunit Mcm2 (Cdc46/Mcm family)